MAVVRFAGFELGDYASEIGVGTSTEGTISTAIKRNGRRSLRYNANNVFGYGLGNLADAPYGTVSPEIASSGSMADLSSGSGWFTGWIRPERYPDVDTGILYAINGQAATNPISQNDNILRVVMSPTGTLRLQYNAATANLTPIWTDIGSSSSALSLHTWHRIDFSGEQLKNTQAGTAATELKVDGTQISRVTGLTVPTTSPTATRTADGFCAFILRTTNTGSTTPPDLYWDDLWLDDSAFISDNGGVTILKPNAAGQYVGWAGTFAAVDETPHDGTSTQITTNAATAETFGFQSAAEGSVGGTIKGVRLLANSKRTSGAVATLKLRIRSNTTDVDSAGSVGSIGNMSVNYPEVAEMLRATDPATGVAWTTSGLDAIQGGLAVATVGLGIQTTQVIIEVWSTAPTVQGAETFPPVISSISPASGPKAGGTAVTITGVNFQAAGGVDTASVQIGGVALTGVTVVSDTSITGTTAAISKAGVYPVQATNNDGTGTLVSGYTYLPGNSTGNSGNNAGGSTSLIVTMPATATGEQLIAVITVRGTGTTVTQASWTKIDTRSDGTNSNTTTWKRISTGGSEPASYTFTLGTSVKASGVITSTPDVDTLASDQVSSQANASSANVVAPSLTPRRLGAVSIYGGGTAVGTTFTPPTNYTEPANGESASTGGSAATRTTDEQAYDQLASLSATGTLTGVAGAAATNVGVQVLLDPPTIISPIGIVSAEAVNTPILNQGAPPTGGLTISPSAIASAETFGHLRLDPIQLQNQGIASGQAIGTPTLVPIAQILPSGIASAGVFGTPTLVITVGGSTTSPTAIDSSEAFGTPVLLPGSINIVSTAITTGEALGTPTLVPVARILTSGIASGEALGTPTLVSGSVKILPGAIASSEALGVPILLPSNVFILPGGITSAEAVGNYTLSIASVGKNILPSAIASGEVLGTPSLLASAVIISSSAITSAEAGGTPTLLRGGVTVTPSSISAAEAVGVPTLIASAAILPTAISSGETFGNTTLLIGGVVIQPAGIASGEQLGSPVLATAAGPRVIQPTAITSAEAFGSSTLIATARILPSAIGSAESFGNPSLAVGGVLIQPTAINSTEVVSAPVVKTGNVNIQPNGIPSQEIFGRVNFGPIHITSIASAETFGSPIFQQSGGPIIIQPDGVISNEAVGIPILRPGGVIISPTGIASAQSFGSQTILHGQVSIGPTGIGSAEALGTPDVRPGGISIVPSGAVSGEVVGNPTLSPTSQIRPIGISSAELLGLPHLIPSTSIVVEGIATEEAFGFPNLTNPQFTLFNSIDSLEAVGIPHLKGARIRWKWTRQEGFAGTQTGGWPETQSALAGTVKNEGES